MEVTVKSPETYKKVLEIEAPFEDFKETIEKAYQKYQKSVQLPGFRKGKAPLQLVKSRFQGTIESEVLPEIISDLYRKASADHDIKPVNQPRIEDLSYDEGKQIKFRAEVEIQPEINLKKYKGIKVSSQKVKVTKDQVKDYIKYLQESHAQVSRLDREARPGDHLIAEFQELDRTGVPLIGKKMEKREYRLGNGLFGPDFDRQLAGIKAAEERKVRTRVPDDYENKHLAGQEIFFQVKALEVLEKKLPELDDEFAKDQGYDSYRKFEEDTEKKLAESMAKQEKDRVRKAIVTEIIRQNEFVVPPSMVENYLNYLFADRRQYNPDLDEKAFKESSRPYALQQLKEHLVVEEIAKREHVTVGDQDIDGYIQDLSGGNEETRQRVESYMKDDRNRERVKGDLEIKKVLDFLESEANIK